MKHAQQRVGDQEYHHTLEVDENRGIMDSMTRSEGTELRILISPIKILLYVKARDEPVADGSQNIGADMLRWQVPIFAGVTKGIRDETVIKTFE